MGPTSTTRDTVTMTKEDTDRSKAKDSSRAIAPSVSDGSDGLNASGLHTSDDPATTDHSLAIINDDSEAQDSQQLRLAVSQPMTASTSSSSSNPSVKDATIGTASPYGTRSRNRAGISRPNYAEDREMELEFEIQPVKEDDTRKIVRSGEPRFPTAPDSAPSTNSIRRASQVDYNSSGHIVPKDHIPGTSTFSANPSAATVIQPSKKRKATGQPATSINNLQPFNNAASSGSQANTRRASVAAQSATIIRDSNMLSFESCAGRLKDGKLIADDGTLLAVNDHVYLVCEPPGEPYYLGRIMEFLHTNNDADKAIDALRINWYYRPKDIGRKVNDTRQVFASMHSDTSPLTALRGLCQIRHKSDVQNMEEYKRTQNCFWYEKLYDRYIVRYYEVIPTRQIVNVPANVKHVLDERWKFILVESGRGKELTSAVKSCKRCSGYCASNDSVDCAVCRQTYHMNCVRPPLLKKPSRGFAWACGPCSRAQERKLEARNTPNLADAGLEADEEEIIDEEEDDVLLQGDEAETGVTSPVRSIDGDLSIHPGTAEQIYQASLWPFRYLGVHCKVEDALDYDDRIYPRASSRLGPRHQANVTIWHGRPVELVKPAEIKKKYMKGAGHKKDPKLSRETLAALEAEKIAREKRPKWVIDEPQGYVHRGEDYDNDDPSNTAELLFKPPEFSGVSSPEQRDSISDTLPAFSSFEEHLIDDYMVRAKLLAKHIGVPDYSVNFLDKALSIFYLNNYDTEIALKCLSKIEKKDLKEPELGAAEVKKFEDGVAKFGSELHSVKKHVRTVSSADIVRFYYTWKKTDRGKQVWGNYTGRKGKKEAKRAEASAVKLQDDVADDHDDSAFDNDKAMEKKRGFQCKFCGTRNSRQWRRAPNTAAGTTVFADPSGKISGKEKPVQLMVALCLNCAVVWRKYAVQWEDGDEHGKKATQNGGRTGKRKVDDTLSEFQLNDVNLTGSNTEAANTPTAGTPMPATSGLSSAQEPVRKKAKSTSDKEQIDSVVSDTGSVVLSAYQRKKMAEKAAAPPPVPEVPKAKPLPCSICLQMEPLGDQHLSCKECRMAVHRNCYGVVGETRGSGKWVCDMCSNDRNPQVSVHYKCTLCPIELTEQDFIEPPKVSHKKKSEKDREKDRIERENAQKVADYYRKKQEELGRPVNPREPLKRTANNNWVHVTCAVWTPEVKFGKAKALEPSEGIPSIPPSRYDEVCKACKRSDNGACVACHSCRAPVHVECAHQNGYILGFDIAPVKGSRRDQFNIVSINGEAGTMTAAIWCKDHVPTKTIVHRMYDIVDETGLNALQLYVQNFKQADLTLTGTVRKATLVNQSTKIANPTSTVAAPNRRTSTTTVVGNGARGSISNIKLEEIGGSASLDLAPNLASAAHSPRICITCDVDISPKWWPYRVPSTGQSLSSRRPLTGGSVGFDGQSMSNGSDAGFEQHIGKALTNGHLIQKHVLDSPKHHVALAAAALEEKTRETEMEIEDYQCHKCHHRRVLKPSTSPPQTASVSQEAIHPQPSSRATMSPAIASPPGALVSPHYSWPSQRAYSPPAPPSTWSRPSPAPAPAPAPAPVQSITAVHQFSGSRSPHGVSNGHHLSGQPQIRQSVVPIPLSPHINGSLGQQISNGYPPSPHRILGAGHQIQSSTLISYASTRPPPQQLTNGSPPLRAPDNPFSQGAHIHHHSPFGNSPVSPPIPRENLPLSREHSTPGQSSRSVDGRVNGGASANPSLHNLLS